jgi:4-oxalmesaconate hydratase
LEEAVGKPWFGTTLYDSTAMEFLIKRIGPDQLPFGCAAFGTGRAVDPGTGRDFDHTVRYVTDIDWRSDADRVKGFSGNARKPFTRAKWLA